jgi:predicted dehydrogenase
MWIFGDVEKATADIQVAVGNYEDTDEMGQGLIHFKSGVSATLTAGWVDIECPVTLIISGTEGHAIIDRGDLYFRSKKVEGADGREPWKKLPKSPVVPIHQFINAVQGKEEPLVKPTEAADRVAVMEAMYKGSKKSTWVKI